MHGNVLVNAQMRPGWLHVDPVAVEAPELFHVVRVQKTRAARGRGEALCRRCDGNILCYIVVEELVGEDLRVELVKLLPAFCRPIIV